MKYKAASIRDVAALAGVSNATVSRVINGETSKVSEETRNRVKAIIQASNYRPSGAGSSLRKGTSKILAVIINDRENTHNLAIAASIEKAANEYGKVMILCATQDSPDRQDEFLAEMRSQLACGIVLVGAVKSAGLRAAVTSNLPIIFVSRRSPIPTSLPYIGVDNYQAAEEVAQHFLSLGLRSVAIFHGPRSSSSTDERVRGFQNLFVQRGHGEVSLYEAENFKKETAYVLAKAALSHGKSFDGIFCTTDDLAYGVGRAYREIGKDLEKDIYISGFDGNSYNEYLAPWLSSVRVDTNEYGKKVTSFLRSKKIENKAPEIIIPHSIFMRNY